MADLLWFYRGAVTWSDYQVMPWRDVAALQDYMAAKQDAWAKQAERRAQRRR